MAELNYSNYLETSLADNLEFFNSTLKDNWSSRWSEEVLEVMRDAYCVGISEMWVDNKLVQGNKIDIYKQIIIKCRDYIEQALRQQDEAWKEQLIMLRNRYQTELLKELTNAIRDFCMEV